MRPPGAILSPGESLIATGNNSFVNLYISYVLVKRCNLVVMKTGILCKLLYLQNYIFLVVLFHFIFTVFSVWFCMHLLVFKFVEPPENNEKPMDQKTKLKFKIMSLKVKGAMDYAPELVRLSHLSLLLVLTLYRNFHVDIMRSIFKCCNFSHVKF